MPRKLRLEYAGAIYHLMNRGDRKEDIFVDDPDRQRFLETLGEACQQTGWQIHAYCLMRNHFHLAVETVRANLSSGMQWFLGAYTARFNRRHKLFRHLFSGRYKSFIVDGSGDGYLKTLCDYVHLNPARARLIQIDGPLSAYWWSSYAEYLRPPKQRPEWLRTDRLLGEWGVGEDNAVGRRPFEAGMEQWKEQEMSKGRGLEATAAVLALGAEEFPGEPAGTDRREEMNVTSRGGTWGIGRAEGATAGGRDVAGGGLEGIGVGQAVERGREKGANGGAIAGGDGDDVALDCGAAGGGALANGRQRSAESGAGPSEIIQAIYSISHL